MYIYIYIYSIIQISILMIIGRWGGGGEDSYNELCRILDQISLEEKIAEIAATAGAVAEGNEATELKMFKGLTAYLKLTQNLQCQQLCFATIPVNLKSLLIFWVQ